MKSVRQRKKLHTFLKGLLTEKIFLAVLTETKHIYPLYLLHSHEKLVQNYKKDSLTDIYNKFIHIKKEWKEPKVPVRDRQQYL